MKLTPAFLTEVANKRNKYGYRYAPVLAKEYGVAVKTVHRWVWLAAKMGLLEPVNVSHVCKCKCGKKL